MHSLRFLQAIAAHAAKRSNANRSSSLHVFLFLKYPTAHEQSIRSNYAHSTGIVCYRYGGLLRSQKALFGSAYGIRTRDLRLERAVSLASRRMRHACLEDTGNLF